MKPNAKELPAEQVSRPIRVVDAHPTHISRPGQAGSTARFDELAPGRGCRLRAVPALGATPLIALTGYGLEADRERSREAGIDYHLIKPVDLEELRRVIVSRCAANPAAGD
jgi:hypothetical protein